MASHWEKKSRQNDARLTGRAGFLLHSIPAHLSFKIKYPRDLGYADSLCFLISVQFVMRLVHGKKHTLD